MAYLKKSQEDRAREKEEDSKVREIERKEDMQKILEMIAIGVQKEVKSVMKPLEERLDMQEKTNMEMSRQFITIKEELEALKKVMNGQEFPSLPSANSGPVFPRLELTRTLISSEDNLGAAEGEIKQMCADARRVIGLTPISPRMLELQINSYGAKDKEEAMLMEVKSFLKCEMKVKPSEIEKLDIVRVFHPARDDWNVLYIELDSEYQVDSLFSYTRVMEKKDHRVLRWIPKKMYQRFSALQTVAYNMRKNDGVKTRVKVGQSDFELSIRQQGSSFWQRCQLPTDLPKIESNLFSSLQNSSSPPPGRPGRGQVLAAILAQDKDSADRSVIAEDTI